MLQRLVPELRIPLAVFIVLIGMGIAQQPQQAPEPGVAYGWAQVIYLIIAVGLSLLAGQLAKKDTSPLRDDKPTTLATRGSFIPMIKGRRRTGFIFAWAGARDKHTRVATGAGKGDAFEKPRETVYLEDGWHILAVGQHDILWEIDEGGKVILQGPIHKDVFPSGSTISLGEGAGTLRIFWGELDQPINTYLGNADRVGISSRWPGTHYVEWRGKNLGVAPTWPNITYVTESSPQENHLTHTTQTHQSNKVGYGPDYWYKTPLTGANGNLKGVDPYDFDLRVGSMTDGSVFIDVKTIQPNIVSPESQPSGEIIIRWSGNSLPAANQDYTAEGSMQVFGVLEQGTDYYTRFTLKSGESLPAGIQVDGLSGTGTVQLYVDGADSGWNGGHLLASHLFDKWPRGLRLDKTKWDLDSFDALATLTTTEDLRMTTVAQDGKTVQQVVGELMQDLGCTISMNPRTAKLEVVTWRLPSGTLANIPAKAFTKKPQKRLLLGPRKTDRLVFVFADEAHAFKDMTIHVDDDGQARLQEFFRQDVTGIPTTTNYASAAKIAQRRAAEELSRPNIFRIYANRAARALRPGEAVTVEGFDEIMRITSLKFDPLSGQVELAIMNDFYGATLSEFVQPPGKLVASGAPFGPDPFLTVMIEIPEWLLNSNAQSVSMFAIRGATSVQEHGLFISRDDTTYTQVGVDETLVTGGKLNSAFSSDGEWLLDQGPEFTVLGSDISDVLDLSADTTSWRSGRQLAIMADASGAVEVFYLQKVSLVSGSTYRLDGLIRARYDSSPLSFASNAVVVIVQNDEGFPIRDVLLEPSVTLYGKAVPTGGSLAETPKVSTALYGKGVRPLPVKNVRLDISGEDSTDWTDFHYKVTGASPADDLVFTWSYFTSQAAGTGAGQFAAGTAQVDAPSPEGDFQVEVLNSGDVVQRSLFVTTNTYTYTRADRIADFGVEPASFKVRVTQTRGGQLSDTTTQTITKV